MHNNIATYKAINNAIIIIILSHNVMLKMSSLHEPRDATGIPDWKAMHSLPALA